MGIDFQREIDKSKGHAPSPPASEQQERLDRAREYTRSHGLDGLLIFGSAELNPQPIHYLAGYVHVYPSASSFLILPAEESPILLIDQDWHVKEAEAMSWVDDIRPFPSAVKFGLTNELVETFESALTDAGLDDNSIGIFDAHMPHVYAKALERSDVDIEFKDGVKVWDDVVATPSKYDREMVKETAAIADKGLEAAITSCQSGISENEVGFEALREMASYGADFLHGSGQSTHINFGSHSHCISNVRPYLFTGNRLERGQMFWIDLTAAYGSYYIDCDRTIAIGEPTETQREIYDTCYEMYEAMAEALEPGVKGDRVWDAGLDVAAAAGYEDYVNFVYFGHTTGIETSVRPVIADGYQGEIKPGSFVNLEPGIFVPGEGSSSLENTFYVTEESAEPVNEMGLELHVV